MTEKKDIIFGILINFKYDYESQAIDSITKIDLEALDHKMLYVVSSMPRSINPQYAVDTTIKLEQKGIITRSVLHLYPELLHLVEYEAFSKLNGVTHLIKMEQQDTITTSFLELCQEKIKEGITCIQNEDTSLTVVPFSIVNRTYPLVGDYDSTIKEIKQISMKKGLYFKNGEKK